MSKPKDFMKTRIFKLFEKYSYLELTITFMILLAVGAGLILKK